MECKIYERQCTQCGECELCDLDPKKRCDNCCKCIDGEAGDFSELRIDAVVDAETYLLEGLDEPAELLEDDEEDEAGGVIYAADFVEGDSEDWEGWEDEEDDEYGEDDDDGNNG